MRDGEQNEIVLQPDGTYIEFDMNNVPLGTWAPDENGVWQFEPFIPLAALPTTGELSASVMLGFIGLLLAAAGLLLRRRRYA